MIKFRMYFDKEKACKWLNEMAENGWRAVGFAAGFWKFVPCEKGAYQYQIDFSTNPFHVSEEYRQLMEDMERHVVSVWGPWILLEAPGDVDLTALYTDSESLMEQKTKTMQFFRIECVVEFVACGLLMSVVAQTGVSTALRIFAIVFGIIAGTFALIFLKRVWTLQDEINQCKAALGEAVDERRQVSLAIPLGCLILLCGFLTSEPGSFELFSDILKGVGIGLLFLGILRTRLANA